MNLRSGMKYLATNSVLDATRQPNGTVFLSDRSGVRISPGAPRRLGVRSYIGRSPLFWAACGNYYNASVATGRLSPISQVVGSNWNIAMRNYHLKSSLFFFLEFCSIGIQLRDNLVVPIHRRCLNVFENDRDAHIPPVRLPGMVYWVMRGHAENMTLVT